MLVQGCNHCPLMIPNHYTKAYQLVKNGNIKVDLVVRQGWGDLVCLGLVRAKVFKDRPAGILQGQGRLYGESHG